MERDHNPPHVREYVTHVATRKHNTFKKHDSIHRDCDISWTLFGLVSDLETIVSFQSKSVKVDLPRRRVGVTNFSTRGRSKAEVGDILMVIMAWYSTHSLGFFLNKI
jgi:hypothetical protein